MNGRQLVEWILYEAAAPSVDEVCTMPGRSHGQCWGCPITTCPRQVTPFEVAELDSRTIEKAIQKLKNNQIWIGDKSGREILALLGDDPATALLALFVDARDSFLLNQAVESARVGHQTAEQAAASVRYLSKDNNNPKSFRRFKELVGR